MPTINEILQDHGLRPGAGKHRTKRTPGWTQHGRRFGHFIDGAVDRRRGETFAIDQPGRRQAAGAGRRRHGRRTSTRAVAAARTRAAGLGRRSAATAARSICTPSRALHAEARAPVRRAGDAGQRQADPRDAATSTCRWSPATSTTTPAGRSCIESEFPGYRAGRRRRPDHPVELPAADAGLEDRAGARRRQHRRAQAGRVHAADRAAVRRDLPARPACRRAWSTSSPATARPAQLIVDHPGIDKIAFTGSTEVGRIIRKATAGTGKKLSLELGGKSPFIVFDDADLDSAVEGVVDAIWFNQGQVCCAGSRLLVQEGVAERFIAKLQARMADAARRRPARQGDRHRRASSRRCSSSASAAWSKQGARRGRDVCAARHATCPTSGCFFPPTLITDVAPAATVAQEEIFGPVLVAMTFRTPDEAVAAGQQHPLRPGRLRLEREHQPRARRRAASSRPAWSGSTPPTVRRRLRLRRLPRERLRPRGRHAKACTSI